MASTQESDVWAGCALQPRGGIPSADVSVGPAVDLRPERADDEPFLFDLYASVRADELDPLGWDDATRAAFLGMQFHARQRAYLSQYPDADSRVVCVDGRPVGRILIASSDEVVRLVDVALLPDYRGSGLGTRLLGDLLDVAARGGKRVLLHVEAHNRARRLYERLGFREIADHGVYVLMEWRQREEGG